MRILMLSMLLLLVGAGDAQAKAFEAKTSRLTLSPREVDRALLLEKGWFEVDLGMDYKLATGYWGPERPDPKIGGEALDFESAEWLYTTERIGIRYGVSRRAEIYATVPFHYVNLTNAMGTDTSTFGIGDPHIGWIFNLYKRQAPTTNVVFYIDHKAPAGGESGGSYIGGPNIIDKFVLSTGTPDFTFGLGVKQQFGPLAGTLKAGYTARFGAPVQYIIELDQTQFAGRIKPGDIQFADASLLIQAGPVALQGGGLFQKRNATSLGTSGSGEGDLFGNGQLVPVAGSEGMSLDVKADLIANITRGFDIQAGVGIPVIGEDLQFFPLEDIQPTRGMTMSGTIKLRY